MEKLGESAYRHPREVAYAPMNLDLLPYLITPGCYLLTLLVGDKIPFVTLSKGDIGGTIVVSVASVHSGMLWMGFFWKFQEKDGSAFPVILLPVFYAALVLHLLYSRKSLTFAFYCSMFGWMLYDRIAEYLSAPIPSAYAWLIIVHSCISAFGGLALFGCLTFGVEGLGLTPSRWLRRADDGQFWYMLVLLPFSGWVKYWLDGLYESGAFWQFIEPGLR